MIAGEFIPADGEVVEGVATVDESAITGESAPVIREAGGDRSAVTAGTRVLSDRIVVKATATQGSTFLDRMIALVEGAARKKTPNEIALTVLLSGLSLIFVLAVATIPAFAAYSGGLVSVVALAALFIALIPTTIGGLLSTIGIDLVAPLSAIGAPAIIVLSALGEEARKVKALDAGADDFVTKPFGVGEFMARVRAALRHRLAMKGSAGAYDDGRLHVDLVRRAVSINGEDPKLTPREFDLLSELVTHAGKVLTHRHLLNSVWRNADAADVEALRVHIRNLRQKVEADPQKPALILTELGVGYRFSAPA